MVIAILPHLSILSAASSTCRWRGTLVEEADGLAFAARDRAGRHQLDQHREPERAAQRLARLRFEAGSDSRLGRTVIDWLDADAQIVLAVGAGGQHKLIVRRQAGDTE